MARKPRKTTAAKPAEAGPSAAKANETKNDGADGAGTSEVPANPDTTGASTEAAANSGANDNAGTSDGKAATTAPAATTSSAAKTSRTPKSSKPTTKTKTAKETPTTDPDEPERQTFEVTGQILSNKRLYRIGEEIECTFAQFETFKRTGAVAGDWQE